jgi:hypothetical protein
MPGVLACDGTRLRRPREPGSLRIANRGSGCWHGPALRSPVRFSGSAKLLAKLHAVRANAAARAILNQIGLPIQMPRDYLCFRLLLLDLVLAR